MPSEDSFEHTIKQTGSEAPLAPIGSEGLVRVEADQLDKVGIEALKSEAVGLQEAEAVVDALECAILYDGWQAVVDTYGVDKFLDIVTAKEDIGVHDMVTFFEKIEPDAGKRKDLLAAISGTNSDALYADVNEKAAGVHGSHRDADNLDRGREFHVQDLEAGKAHFVEDDTLFSMSLPRVLEAHPEVVADFKETGDLVSLLGSLREQYNGHLESYAQRFEEAKEQIENIVSSDEQEVQRQQEGIAATLAAEVVTLEEKLSSGDFELFADTLRAALEQRTAEIRQLQEGFSPQLQAVRANVYGQLGLSDSGLAGYKPTQPSITEPVYRYKQAA